MPILPGGIALTETTLHFHNALGSAGLWVTPFITGDDGWGLSLYTAPEVTGPYTEHVVDAWPPTPWRELDPNGRPKYTIRTAKLHPELAAAPGALVAGEAGRVEIVLTVILEQANKTFAAPPGSGYYPHVAHLWWDPQHGEATVAAAV